VKRWSELWRLDPNLEEAHAQMGRIKMFVDLDWEGSEEVGFFSAMLSNSEEEEENEGC
jgi:hypothetical protein